MSKNLIDLSLEEFLEYKTLYYDKIDFSIVKNAWKTIKLHLKLPYVIHIVGTNGKGTTGRFLAHYLNKSSYDILHYTSPHIQSFNERIWINGEDVSDELLEDTHNELKSLLDIKALKQLTYFEYTTLLALTLSSKRDYLILEAGLGGEFDATNVVKNDLTLLTTIGLDHMNFLGNTIESIAKTKMRSCDSKMIVGHQEYDEVIKHAKTVCQERNAKCFTFNEYDLENLMLPNYLKRNLNLSLSALEYLNIPINLELFKDVSFQGRFEQVSHNIIIDVGHNPLAAKQILSELKSKNKKVILVYNSYEDKDYEEVLRILKPVIKEVKILPLNDSRVVEKTILMKVCDNLNIMSSEFEQTNDSESYLVFGSFLVVEEFLKLTKELRIDEK